MLFLQLRHVFADVLSDVDVLAIFHSIMVSVQWFDVHTYFSKRTTRSTHFVHLRSTASTCDVFVEEKLLL